MCPLYVFNIETIWYFLDDLFNTADGSIAKLVLNMFVESVAPATSAVGGPNYLSNRGNVIE